MSRALVSESSFVFKEVQRKNVTTDPLSKKEVIQASRKYRSIIHATTAKLDANSDEQQKVVFNQIEVIWHLCEIMFVDLNQTGVMLTQLLTWIRWHHPNINHQREKILNSNAPHTHEDYWDIVTSYVLRGEVENALKLLKLHPKVNDKEFSAVCELLLKMPIFSSGLPLYEYDLRWQVWRNECQVRFEAFEENEYLHRILGILAGDVPTFKYVLHLVDSWYHLMISLLLYTDPTMKEMGIPMLAKQCVDIYLKSDPQKQLTPFDNILIAAFNYDLMQVIMETSSSVKDNWWFVTHFVDLMYNGNLLEFFEVVEPTKLRESLILDYANSLLGHPSLWFIAVDYMDTCPNLGRQHLELSLERIPFQDEKKALKIIQVAEKRELTEVVKSIQKTIACKWLSHNRLGSALVWAIRSEDPALTTYIANLYLKEYVKNRTFPDEDVLCHLGPLMLICDRLIFLGKYCEFCQFRKQGFLQEAGDILVNLISSKICPSFFISTLLTDSIVLLEAETQVLNHEQTHQILAALDDLKLAFGTDMASVDEALDFGAFSEKEDILKLAISRNMARASI